MPAGARVKIILVGDERDRGSAAGRVYLERGQPVVVLVGWRGNGPRNVLIQRADGTRTVRPFRGLRKP